MPVPFPDDMWLYCGVSALIIVGFCCCFHVIELIKLRYLRKLTSSDHFSLSGISTDFSCEDGGSRLSTRRNTRIVNSPQDDSDGNFSIFTVITYAEGNNRTFEMKTVATSNPGNGPTASNGTGTGVGDIGESTEQQRGCTVELLDEMPSSSSPSPGCPRGNSGNETRCDHQMNELLPPPKYEVLFPRSV